MGWRRVVHWKAFAVGIQVAAVCGCGVLGWQLVHGRASVPPVAIHGAVAAAPPVLGIPGLPALSTAAAHGASQRPGLPDLLQRVNRDDAGLYRGQWATIQLLARGTRSYVESRIVPLLLAAARGGVR